MFDFCITVFDYVDRLIELGFIRKTGYLLFSIAAVNNSVMNEADNCMRIVPRRMNEEENKPLRSNNRREDMKFL